MDATATTAPATTKRGRPPLPPEQRRRRKIEARCTDRDRELFEALLATEGMTEADLVLAMVRERAERVGVQTAA